MVKHVRYAVSHPLEEMSPGTLYPSSVRTVASYTGSAPVILRLFLLHFEYWISSLLYSLSSSFLIYSFVLAKTCYSSLLKTNV